VEPFIIFGKYSIESIQEISAARTEAAMALIRENGGSLVSAYALLGEYDVMLIAEFSGIEQAMKTSVGLAKLLGIAFTTCPAVTMEQFDKLVG
jgi:uncharacterized protein with GYD domain